MSFRKWRRWKARRLGSIRGQYHQEVPNDRTLHFFTTRSQAPSQRFCLSGRLCIRLYAGLLLDTLSYTPSGAVRDLYTTTNLCLIFVVFVGVCRLGKCTARFSCVFSFWWLRSSSSGNKELRCPVPESLLSNLRRVRGRARLAIRLCQYEPSSRHASSWGCRCALRCGH